MLCNCYYLIIAIGSTLLESVIPYNVYGSYLIVTGSTKKVNSIDIGKLQIPIRYTANGDYKGLAVQGTAILSGQK